MIEKDLYAILGVLPNAEDIVIAAAYRVLASRYHPDKNQDNPSDAHEKMSSLNAAFEVLGDREKRRNYDSENKNASGAILQDTDCGMDQIFNAAIKEISENWKVAIEFYPKLDLEITRLLKYSPSLSYAFAVSVLQSKRFSEGKLIADELIANYIKRFFGKNQEITRLAITLIEKENRVAARELNRYVLVMGESHAHLIQEKIFNSFGYKYSHDVQELVSNFGTYQDIFSAVRICKLLGYQIEKKYKFAGMFLDKITSKSPDGTFFEFSSERDFFEWVLKSLSPLLLA